MDSYHSFLIGAASAAIIILIAWLSSNLMRAERVILSVDKKTQKIQKSELMECATYPYIQTYMGFGYSYPFWMMRMRPRHVPYFVPV